MKNKLRTFVLLQVMVLMWSCDTALEEYYRQPDWLKGNAWEVLESKGNFTLFLSAVEKSSFRDLVQGKGIVTVMAPDDGAFNAYLKEKGYSGIDAIPAVELEKLVAYHLVYYSFSKAAFEDYKPDGTDSENDLRGIYYKFRTKSRDDNSVWNDQAFEGKQRKVIHKERFLPVFSHYLFESLKIDAEANYTYFFPSSEWTGEQGFNVSNASVNEYAIVTDNGYVYTLNKVIEPLETVYNALRKQSDYSMFVEAYDRFASYIYDADATTAYGNGDSLYVRSHGSELPAIASEWTNTASGVDYTQLSALSRRANNVFAPDNQAMQAFFNTYWSAYYSDLSKVNFLPLMALLANHVHSGDVVFPEMIEKGQVKSPMGTLVSFNRSDAKLRRMCVNGTVYGLNKLLTPPVFTQVTSPLYRNPSYTMLLDMCISSDFINPLLSDQVQFTLFLPTDEMIETNTTLEGRQIKYVNTNANLYGAQTIQIEGDLGLEDMKVNQKKSIAGNHIATRVIMQRNDTTVYATMNPFNYLYSIGSKVYSSALYNTGDQQKAPEFTAVGTYPNGKAYQLSGESASALVPETNQLKNMITSVASPADFEYFKALVAAASIDKTAPPYNFLLGERFIVLVPSNAAVLQGFALGKVPFSPASKVADFLKPYFINVSASGLIDYPFAGTGVDTELVSFGRNSKGEIVKFRLLDKGKNLVLIDAKGKEHRISTILPRIYADGAAYIIDSLPDVE